MDDIQRYRFRKARPRAASDTDRVSSMVDLLVQGVIERGGSKDLLNDLGFTSMLFGAIVGQLKIDLGFPEVVIQRCLASVQNSTGDDPYWLEVTSESIMGRPVTDEDRADPDFDSFLAMKCKVDLCARYFRVCFNEIWEALIVQEEHEDYSEPALVEEKREQAIGICSYMVSALYEVLPEANLGEPAYAPEPS